METAEFECRGAILYIPVSVLSDISDISAFVQTDQVFHHRRYTMIILRQSSCRILTTVYKSNENRMFCDKGEENIFGFTLKLHSLKFCFH